MFRFRWVAAVLAGLLLAVWLAVAVQIVAFGERVSADRGDVAIVLGAAAWGNKPSPVYRERINQALLLYRQGRVQWIIFTGGTRAAGFPSEAEVGLQFALANGVPSRSMLLDRESRTTWENLRQAQLLMTEAGLHTALLVSDPLHLKRATAMALDLGIAAQPVATASSRFQSLPARGRFLWRETWLYIGYLLFGPRFEARVQSGLDFGDLARD